MAKNKEFVEGIDYVITIRKRKKFIKNPVINAFVNFCVSIFNPPI